MLKQLSGVAALAAAVSLVAGPALAAQDKHAPSAQGKHAAGSPAPGKPAFEHVHALAVTADGRTLFLGAHSGLFRSEEAGRSWQPVALPSKHPHVDVMAVMPHTEDERTVYVATHEAGVFKTTDGGKTW
ncbi:MAG: WD40/YVTN/BNR-like repeat-containing protein, partial [Vicinamibacterales bacterium]